MICINIIYMFYQYIWYYDDIIQSSHPALIIFIALAISEQFIGMVQQLVSSLH